MEAPDVAGRAFERLPQIVPHPRGGTFDLVSGHGDFFEPRAVESPPEIEKRALTANPHVLDDLPHQRLDPGLHDSRPEFKRGRDGLGRINSLYQNPHSETDYIRMRAQPSKKRSAARLDGGGRKQYDSRKSRSAAARRCSAENRPLPNTPEASPQREAPRHSAPAVACVGCLAVGVLGMLAAMLTLAIYSRHGKVPEPLNNIVRLQECTRSMASLSGAMARYHNKNGEYPASLGQLYPDFLKSPAVLSCPMAVPNASGSEYEYTRPPAAAPGTFVAIRCRRHRFRTIRVVLEGRLDGSVASRQNGVARVISPAERSIMKRPAEPEAGK